jgi:hypothetical protein
LNRRRARDAKCIKREIALFWETFLRFCRSTDNRNNIESFLFRYFLGYGKAPGRSNSAARRKMLNGIDVEEVFTFLSERNHAPRTSIQFQAYTKKVWEVLLVEIGQVFTRFRPNVDTRRVFRSFLRNHVRHWVAAKQATAVIPIVFAAASDPVGTGLVASLARPGGNVTGLANQISDTGGKKLELLREAVPGLRRLAIMANVGNPASVLDMAEAQAAARALGLGVTTSEIWRAEDISAAFDALKGRVDALYVCVDPLVNTHRIRVNTLALAARLPTMHGLREYVEAGGLMSYGPNLPDLLRRAADYVDKILRGAKPGDIPVEQPTKFDLVINLKTAKALGLEVPPTLLARADEVIE